MEITILLEWILGKYLEMYVVSGLLFNVLLGFFQEERANAAALALLKSKLKANAPSGTEVGEQCWQQTWSPETL